MSSYLFVNPYGIGDALFTLRVAQSLRTAMPQARIGFLANERTADLLRLAPFIDRVHTLDRDGFRSCGWARLPGKALALFSEVARERYGVVLDLSLQRELSFYAALAGIPVRIGFDHKGRGIFLTRKLLFERYEGAPVSSTQARLLAEAGVKQAPLSAVIDLRTSQDAGRRAEELLRPIVGGSRPGAGPLSVAPGGGRSWGDRAIYKQWDADRFSAAAGRYARSRGCGVVLLGDAPEVELLRRTAHGIEAPTLVLAGEPIEVVCAVLRRTRALLCNDGGLMHLAVALGVPVVALFGPVDARTYGPHGSAGSVLTADVPCRPCYGSFHFPLCTHDRCCLDRIPVDKAVSALEEIV